MNNRTLTERPQSLDVLLYVVTLVCFAMACSFLIVFGFKLKYVAAMCVEESLLPQASTKVLAGLPEDNAAPVQMWMRKALDSQLMAFSVRRRLSLTHMIGRQHPPCYIAWL